MNERVMTVHIPDELYERIQREAEASERTPERILIESVQALLAPISPADDVDVALADLASLSDSHLWATVHQRLPWVHSQRLHDLNAKARESELSDSEEHEFDRLLYLVDYQMLLRAEALVLLKKRGHDVSLYVN
jgi:hypothetical protein